MTKSEPLLDAIAYAGLAAGAQTISHLVLARDPTLPETWEQLVGRYAAGSGINAAALTLYALQTPEARATDAALVLWGVLLGSGAAVAALHLHDAMVARRAARQTRAALSQEDGHVARPPISTISLLRNRGG